MAFGQSLVFPILLLVVFVPLIWLSSRKSKAQQEQIRQFRQSLKPGVEVISIGGIIGKVVSVDERYEEIVVDSEGSLLRFSFQAINREHIRPDFIDDAEDESEQTTADMSDNPETPVADNNAPDTADSKGDSGK